MAARDIPALFVNACPQGGCVVCGEPGSACARCLTVYYCSSRHQRAHWDSHRPGCAPYRLLEDPEMGRFLLATGDIPAGTIIMREEPVVVLPAPEPDSVGSWVCVGCCRVLRGLARLWARCSRCSWPVCGPACELSSAHREECANIHRANFCFNDDDLVLGERLLALGTLRCALARRRSVLLQRLQCQGRRGEARLPHHPLAEMNRSECYRILEARVRAVRHFLGVHWISEAELFSGAAMAAFNAVFVGDDELQYSATGLLPGVSMVQHSCRPNLRVATLEAQAGGRFETVLVTVQDVPAGEPLTLSYVSDPFSSTLERRLLCGYGFFSCRCERCQDDSEFGLYVSAWCCRVCKRAERQSMVVLQAPLESPSLTWACQTCRRAATAGEILYEMVELEEELRDVLARGGEYIELEMFINKHLFPAGSCHQTHRVMLRAKRAVLDALSPERLPRLFRTHEDAFRVMDRRVELCEELLQLLQVLKPGRNAHRRQMLAYLSETVLVKVNLGILSGKLPYMLAEAEVQYQMSYLNELGKCMVTPKEKKKFAMLMEEVNSGVERLKHCKVPWPEQPTNLNLNLSFRS